MDLILFILMILNLTVVTYNQSSDQFNNKAIPEDDPGNAQKTDRILQPMDPNVGSSMNLPINSPMGMQMGQPMGSGNFDPIEASYQRQQSFPNNGFPMGGSDSMMSRIPPGGNFPGDLPAPGIPSQPGMSNIDRHMPGIVGDSCLSKLRYYMASCEDALLQRQRDARNARTAPDIQRRLCCSLYFYYDCLSKLVVQYCRDASPMVVNLVMPENRRRELAISCRTNTRDQCNAAVNLNFNWYQLLPLITALVILIHF